MIIYLTFNDLPSGIFSSQVIDVVKFLNTELNTSTKLVSFISIRNFKHNKGNIKKHLPDSIVLPMFPKLKNWRLNRFLLKTIIKKLKPSVIIGRSVLATQLAFLANNNSKIVYDGRGAITAEWKEYKVVTDTSLLNEIHELERGAVLHSDFRIAVSAQLVKYWENEFKYKGGKEVIIPCTINNDFEEISISEKTILECRSTLGLNPQDLVFVYSGSVAGWQSFNLLYDFLSPLLQSNNLIKVLFLSDRDKNIQKLEAEFPGKIICLKVKPNEVVKYLLACNVGLLIREESVTNKVASPVKFAEYLACGLKVIISNHLGDYTDFSEKSNCGVRLKKFDIKQIPSLEERNQFRQLALQNFTKASFIQEYKKVTTI